MAGRTRAVADASLVAATAAGVSRIALDVDAQVDALTSWSGRSTIER